MTRNKECKFLLNAVRHRCLDCFGHAALVHVLTRAEVLKLKYMCMKANKLWVCPPFSLSQTIIKPSFSLSHCFNNKIYSKSLRSFYHQENLICKQFRQVLGRKSIFCLRNATNYCLKKSVRYEYALLCACIIMIIISCMSYPTIKPTSV
jgi:hypothetical protein